MLRPFYAAVVDVLALPPTHTSPPAHPCGAFACSARVCCMFVRTADTSFSSVLVVDVVPPSWLSQVSCLIPCPACLRVVVPWLHGSEGESTVRHRRLGIMLKDVRGNLTQQGDVNEARLYAHRGSAPWSRRAAAGGAAACGSRMVYSGATGWRRSSPWRCSERGRLPSAEGEREGPLYTTRAVETR